MIKTAVIPAIVFLALAGSAHAQQCSASSTQADLDQCSDHTFQKSDAALNAAYNEIMKRIKDDSTKTKLLVVAEKAWLGFRDAECKFMTVNSIDGSIYPMLVSDCYASLTDKRLAELKTFLKCEEGDLSCPVPAP